MPTGIYPRKSNQYPNGYDFCKTCKILKKVEEFRPLNIKGKKYFSSYCKNCDIQRSVSYRKNRSDYKAYHLKKINLSIKKYPERQAARLAVKSAIKRGKLIKLPCEVCGEIKVHAHHDDYSKPLKVRWLCHIHHVAIHHPNN